MTKKHIARDILEDEKTGDIAIINNRIILTPDLSITPQKIKRKLSINKGEWFLNADLGIPYFKDIFIKNPDLNLIESLYVRALDSIKQVYQIISLKVRAKEDRQMTVDIKVLDDMGNIVEKEI